ncbi:hypothetical protein [Paenibacillus sp. OV219]|uniref:hypothetical protein n=1 Tax=Paenibacillus sp. OV219 TaxID=1884377 RepID=UPI0008B73B4C|nr:hypothetical protein [Paenibacillus sp. OV219]SEN73982.1 hypothetical protein SAMN05518847_10415 [Paenibacillus sp. OV219]
MMEKEAQTPTVTNEEAASALRQAEQPEEPEQSGPAQAQVGPEGAAPHWREFYQAIRNAVDAMRSS